MTDLPRIGEPIVESRPICCYAGCCNCECAQNDPCERRATRHFWIRDPRRGNCFVQTCDAHATVARQAGLLVAEHAFTGYCGLPATLWDTRRNLCTIDDSGQDVEYTERDLALASRG